MYRSKSVSPRLVTTLITSCLDYSKSVSAGLADDQISRSAQRYEEAKVKPYDTTATRPPLKFGQM